MMLPPVPVVTAPAAEIVTPSRLRFEVLAPGNGRRPTTQDAVQLTYEVRLADGTLVETAPQPVGLAVTDLIPGFTEALLLMNQGGRYRFRLPPALAYGAEGSPGHVPPNAELVFTVTLLRVGRPAAAR
jgi:FKBP-type peptidyl-prolyl cis-trans isomerase